MGFGSRFREISFRVRGSADKMQLVTKATLLAALTAVPVVLLLETFMLIDTAAAVEVTGTDTPLLPRPQRPENESNQPPSGVEPPSPGSFILGSRTFTIPFSVDASGAAPVEVHLYVTRGSQEQWKLLGRKRPDVTEKQFQFTADQDGEYWFATRTMDTRGQEHPSGKIESQLKVYVDTVKPRVKLKAEADPSGRVDAVLEITDATPLKDMQLRYVTDLASQWHSVDIQALPEDGKLQFTPPEGWTQLSLQLVAVDTPGNRSIVTQLIRRPRLATTPDHRFAGGPGGSVEALSAPYRMDRSRGLDALAVANPVIQLDRNKPKPPPNLVRAHGYLSESNPPSALEGFRGGEAIPMTAAPPPLVPVPPVNESATVPVTPAAPMTTDLAQQAPPPAPPATTIPNPFDRLFQRPADPTTPAPNPTAPAPTPFGPPSVHGAPASDPTAAPAGLPNPATAEEISRGFGLNSPAQVKPETAPAAPSTQPAARPRTAAEAMRPLSERSAVPRSEPEQIPTPRGNAAGGGDRRYESMRSPDEIAAGRAPVRYSDSERFSLEYELEAVGSHGVDAIELYGTVNGGRTWELWGRDPDGRSPFDIETKEAGVFGFRIVVISRNGLASPRPLSGETPDIVVVVDKTAPKVRISGAQYGEGNRVGSLVIRYECEDANLTQRPIVLSFSDTAQGPWTTIAAGLRNDGDYVWPADPQLPRQLYLRIDATDHAGNVGTYILDQPIDVQGLAPRARIRGFQSLSGGEVPPPGEQTANQPRAAFK